MDKKDNDELLQAVASAVLAIGALITGDNFVLIGGRKIGKKNFTIAYRQLRLLASKLGIQKEDPVEKVLDEAIKFLNKNNNFSGARLLEQFREEKKGTL